jgi:hypothetical protein
MADFPLPPEPEPSDLFVVKSSRTGSRSQHYSAAWWGLWIVPTLIFSAGSGVWAVKNLLELPSFPQCRSVSKSEVTPSVRMYCAEQLAAQQKVPDWRQAILLINTIPAQDPLGAESRRSIERWSRSILEVGEKEFQAGDLEAAIKTAEAVPTAVHTQAMIEERIERWRSSWQRAEDIYEQTEDDIEQREWSAALNTAKGLLTVGNQFWTTTKYQELMQSLQAAKDSQSLVAKASPRSAARRPNSDRSDSVEAYFARREQERNAENASYLTEARQLADAGSVSGLRDAIDSASRVLYGSDHYDEAQQAIEDWRNQIEFIEDAPYLSQARALAQQGDLASLEAAIAEARKIGWGRALYDEAYDEIQQWRSAVSDLRLQDQTPQPGSHRVDTMPTPYPVQPASAQPTVPAVDTMIDAGRTTGTTQPGNSLN